MVSLLFSMLTHSIDHSKKGYDFLCYRFPVNLCAALEHMPGASNTVHQLYNSDEEFHTNWQETENRVEVIKDLVYRT